MFSRGLSKAFVIVATSGLAATIGESSVINGIGSDNRGDFVAFFIIVGATVLFENLDQLFQQLGCGCWRLGGELDFDCC